MRTTIDIDPGLLEEALEITGEKSRARVVDRALDEMIRRRKIERLISLAGKIKFEGDWDERHERDFQLEQERRRSQKW